MRKEYENLSVSILVFKGKECNKEGVGGLHSRVLLLLIAFQILMGIQSGTGRGTSLFPFEF